MGGWYDTRLKSHHGYYRPFAPGHYPMHLKQNPVYNPYQQPGFYGLAPTKYYNGFQGTLPWQQPFTINDDNLAKYPIISTYYQPECKEEKKKGGGGFWKTLAGVGLSIGAGVLGAMLGKGKKEHQENATAKPKADEKDEKKVKDKDEPKAEKNTEKTTVNARVEKDKQNVKLKVSGETLLKSLAPVVLSLLQGQNFNGTEIIKNNLTAHEQSSALSILVSLLEQKIPQNNKGSSSGETTVKIGDYVIPLKAIVDALSPLRR